MALASAVEGAGAADGEASWREVLSRAARAEAALRSSAEPETGAGWGRSGEWECAGSDILGWW